MNHTLQLDASDEVKAALGKVVTLLCAEERARRNLADADEIFEQADDILRATTERLLGLALTLHTLARPVASAGSC